jgi:acyl carrier protein
MAVAEGRAARAGRGREVLGRSGPPGRGSGRCKAAHKESAVKEMILEYVKNEYLDEDEVDEIHLDENTPLISSGIVDSFSMVSLKRFLEKKYNISIPDEEASPQAFDTVASIIELVKRHRKEA